MAATLVQSSITHSNSVTTVYTGTLTSTVTAGNTIIMAAGGQFGGPAAGVAIFTDTQSDSFTTYVINTQGGCAAAIAVAANVVGGTFTGTVTWDAAQVHNNLVIEEWSGLPATVIPDGTGVGFGNNSGVGMSCGTLVTTNASDLLLAFVVSNANNPLNFTPPTNFTLDQQFTTPIGAAFSHAISTNTTSGDISYSSPDNTGQWGGVSLALQITSAAPVGGAVVNNPLWM